MSKTQEEAERRFRASFSVLCAALLQGQVWRWSCAETETSNVVRELVLQRSSRHSRGRTSSTQCTKPAHMPSALFRREPRRSPSSRAAHDHTRSQRYNGLLSRADRAVGCLCLWVWCVAVNYDATDVPWWPFPRPRPEHGSQQVSSPSLARWRHLAGRSCGQSVALCNSHSR